jgi:DNA-binding CsgD family transcriptional regulator
MGRPAQPLRLIGRDHEVAMLSSTMTAAADGAAKVAFIDGEAGIGKSRVLSEVIGNVGHAFDRVLVAHGHELERERPFGLITDAIDLAVDGDTDRANIADLLRGDSSSTRPAGSEFAELRFRLVEAILRLFQRTAAEGPVLLALEDIHWADPSSLLVIDQLVRRLSHVPIGVIATCRPSPRSVTFDQLRRGMSPEDSVHLRLEPLSTDAVDTLMSAAIGAEPSPGLREVVGGAAGNPFFVTELLTALTESGSIVVRDGRAELISRGELPTLRATILHRLRTLPDPCLEMLTMAAVIGSRFRLDDLAVVADTPASDLVRTLDDAWRTGLLVEADHAIAFRHHLVWDAIYHDVPLAAREALHVQVAQRLGAAGRPASQVATHYLAGASPGDQHAISWLEQAAEQSLARAPAVAAELLQGALALAEDAGTRERISIDLATALTWSGRLDGAEQVLTDLVASPHTAAVDLKIRLGLARVLIIQGNAGAAREHYDRLFQAAGLVGWERARARTDQAVACLLSGDVTAARTAAAEALEIGRAVGDDPAICGGLAASSWVANLEGRTTMALELAEQSVAVATDSTVRETGRRYPHVFLAVVLLDADRIDESRQMYDAGRRLAEAYGDTWQLPIHHLGAALADYQSGAYDDAVAALATADQVVEEVGTRMLFVWSASLGAHLAIEHDDLTEAGRLLSQAEQRVAETGPGIGIDWLLWGRARLLAAEGDVTAAAELLSNAWNLAAALGIISQRRLIGPDLVHLQVEVGDRDGARDTARAMAEAADLSGGVRSVRAAAERCLGVAESDPDRVVAAAELAEACPQRAVYAQTCEDAGRLLAATGRTDEAVSMLTRAVDQFQASGARRGERRVDAALRDLGVARGRRDSRSRPATGWDALTPTELKVARLAAEGLTNPEIGRRLFISPRTVETHLSHAYAKLGVSSRVALAGIAASVS